MKKGEAGRASVEHHQRCQAGHGLSDLALASGGRLQPLLDRLRSAVASVQPTLADHGQLLVASSKLWPAGAGCSQLHVARSGNNLAGGGYGRLAGATRGQEVTTASRIK